MVQKGLQQKIEKYCVWYKFVRDWSLLQCIVFACVGLTALYILCDKIFYLGSAYSLFSLVLCAVGLLVLFVFHVASPKDTSYVSYIVDKNAGLKNLVSSGLSVTEQMDEVSTVIVERAESSLAKGTPQRLMPFRRHWTGRYLYVPIIVLLVAILIPHVDLFARKERKDQKEAERIEVKKGALTLTAKLSSIEKHSQSLNSIESKKILKDFNNLANDLTGITKKEALLKLGEFENKYKENFSAQRNFEKLAKALQSKPDMKGLSPESQKQLKELLKNLNNGKLSDAGKAMRDLAKQLQNKNLSSAEKKALARELGKIAQKMQGAGMSDKLAKLLRDISASPENMDKLLKQCQAASEEMKEFAKFCDECDGLQAMKEGLADAKGEMLGKSFSDLDAKEVEQYMEAQAALGSGCEGCNGSGDGTGGEGRGRGGSPLENMTDTSFESKMSPSKINKGKILHQLFVSGIPEKGESLTEYTDVIKAARQDAAGSLARDKIPREYENMVKTYFDSLELDGGEADGGEAPAAPMADGG